MATQKTILGIDIGGTNMRFGLVNEHFALSSFTIKSTGAVLTGHRTENQLAGAVREYCSEYLGGQLPDAVSIGLPSTIDKTRRIVRSTPNIKGLDNLYIVDILEQALGVPVFINRDTNFLLFFDIHYHKLDENALIIGCYAGTGFGNAVSIDGRMLLGKNGVAAELGHIPMLGKTRVCGCGNAGCIEAYASGRYLEMLREKHFPDTPIGEMFERHLGEPVMEQFVDNLSLPIAGEINIFDPDYAIIGGGLIFMKNFPVKNLERQIHTHTRKPYPDENLQLLYSSPKQENGVIGAGIYAYKRLADSNYL